MGIREKLALRQQQQSEKQTDADMKWLDRALFKMSVIIFAGYAIGTVIAMLIERLKRN